ncbi:MAG: thioredoxin [Clostridia bacterium]|nr:thioredoxin [Clostridia bacterium]
MKGQKKLRLLILCAAIVFILLGVMNGGAYDVLVKAINICTECIGLG